MKIITLPVTAFEQNCSILICTETSETVIVDPGGEINKIIDSLNINKCIPKKILITHGHIDHCGATLKLSKILKLPIEGPHIDDSFWINQLEQQAKQFGFPDETKPFKPNKWLKDNDQITFGKILLKVIHCPGHTPGHVVFYHYASKTIIVGDVIFKGSIGRTDFPRGNFNDLVNSIKLKLWPLGDDTTFFPGHGEKSTFAYERKNNPFVGDNV